MAIAGACFSILAPLVPANADTVVSQDFFIQESLSDTGKTYEFTLGTSAAASGAARAMRLKYGRQSQSRTNFQNNAVDWTLEILTDGESQLLWQQADSYPSDTISGSPIPTHEVVHAVDLGTNQIPPGTRMRLSVNVATGDYINRVEWIRVETDWNVSAPLPSVDYGVNLSGAEWGDRRLGTEGVGWAFPTETEIEYFASIGLKHLRIPLAWERLHPNLIGELDPLYLSRMDALAAWSAKYGIALIWDLHNYGRYDGIPLGSAGMPTSSLADTWAKIAQHYANRTDILFSLMNEPHDMLSETVVEMQNLAILAIRAAGASNTIIVNGNAWSGAHSWADSWYGTSNAEAMLNIQDPANNMVYAVHLYFDGDASGTSANVVSETIGVDRLQGVTAWARAHNKRLCVEEIGAARDVLSLAALTRTVEFVEANRDVFHSLQLWAGGPLWNNYMFGVNPDANDQMAPQLKILLPYLPENNTPLSLVIALGDVMMPTNALPAPVTVNWHQGYDPPATIHLYPSDHARVVSMQFDNGNEWNRITALAVYAVFGDNRRELVHRSESIPWGVGREIVFDSAVEDAARLEVEFTGSLYRAIFALTGLTEEKPQRSVILSPRGAPFGSRILIEESIGDLQSWTPVARFYYGNKRNHIAPIRESGPTSVFFRARFAEE